MQQEECLELVNGFRLIQDGRLFKLGMDAILLSGFAAVSDGDRVCDLGCGNGAIFLLLCARYAGITAVGVEIQEKSAQLAGRNVALNRLETRAEVVQCDLRAIGTVLQAGSFRVVVSNPPYRRMGSGMRAETDEKEIARAEVCCTIEEVCRAAAYLLTWGGTFSCVYRPDRLTDLLCAMRDAGLEPKRLQLVQARNGEAPSLLLCEGKRGGKPGIQILPPFVVYDADGCYTAAAAALYAQSNG